jgi:Holliday junction DNA helicase RuvA
MQLHQVMCATIQSIKGIGSKTQRVLDLKDKVLKLYDLDEISMSQHNTNEMRRYQL